MANKRRVWVCNIDVAKEIIIRQNKKPRKKEVLDKLRSKMSLRDSNIYIDESWSLLDEVV